MESSNPMIFFDHKHNRAYLVGNEHNLNDARFYLKKFIVGRIWDEDTDDKTLWENVVLVDKWHEVWIEGADMSEYTGD